MADYIQSLICNQQNKNEKGKDAEEKPLVSSTGMGDFDYKNFPDTVEQCGGDFLEKCVHSIQEICKGMDTELAESAMTQEVVASKFDAIERTICERNEVYQLCAAFYDEINEMEKCSKKMNKYTDSLNHHKEVSASWECLIKDLRKVKKK